MKCKFCESETEIGILAQAYWRPLSALDSIRPKEWLMGAERVDAYRCPNCGAVHLQSTVVNKD